MSNSKHHIFMCPPEHFGVEYEINPWMSGNIDRAAAERAQIQWHGLYDVLKDLAEIHLIDPQPGVPDLVFTANAGLILDNTVILSHFRHPERQREEPFFRDWFREHGYDVMEMPAGVHFEGAGDALFLRDNGVLAISYGFRTVSQAVDIVEQRLRVKTLPLQLNDPRFYHLDTCFCPLTGGKVIYYPEAFTPESRNAIENTIPAENRFAVSEQDALFFSCNAVDTGSAVVLNNATKELEAQLARWGFETIRTPLDEFLLAGGAAKCLTLRLDEPRAAEAQEHQRMA